MLNIKTITLFTFLEPWLCRSPGTSRKSEDQLPHCCHDGSRSSNNYESKTGQLWVYRKYGAGPQVLHTLQAL